MALFDLAVRDTLKIEGGYVNDSTDRGGETNFGVTITTARANGYTGEMKSMTKDDATKIYKSQYWDIMLLDRVTSQEIAGELFDSGVNCSPYWPAKWLQQVLNAIGYKKPWSVLKVDGVVGPTTIYVLNTAVQLGYEKAILNGLNSKQECYYIDIVNNDPTQGKYFDGWTGQRVRFKV